ncbi:FecR family protein [Sphingomonas sp. M1A8_2b]
MTRFGRPIENAADIDAAEAAGWLARHRLGTLDEAAFHAWRDSDVAHAVAFARALAMWESVDDGLSASTTQARSVGSACSRRGFVQASFAMLAVGVIAGGMTATRAYAWKSAATAVGESRTIRLPDGSTAILNTDSRLSWRVSDTERTFWIEHGEVALNLGKGPDAELHDDHRTVMLTAGRFNLRIRSDALDLLVLSGHARSPGKAGSIDAAAGAASSMLLSSSGAIVRPADVGVVDRITAWQHQEILFRDATLGSAVEDYNRFLVDKIVIVDRDLANIPVGGRFVTTDPTAFLNAVSAGLNIRVSRTETGYLLTR